MNLIIDEQEEPQPIVLQTFMKWEIGELCCPRCKGVIYPGMLKPKIVSCWTSYAREKKSVEKKEKVVEVQLTEFADDEVL